MSRTALLLGAALVAAATAVDAQQTSSVGGSYKDGMFLLPDLADAKDSYLIIVKPRTGGDAVQFKLPPGSTGVRVSIGALPKGEWSWEYKQARQSVPVIDLVSPKELSLTTANIAEERYSLGWKRVAAAKKYVLSGESRTKSHAADDPPWTKLEASCFASVCARNEVATKAIELKAGTEVKWTVSALDEDGIVLAKSEEGHIQVANTWVQAASKSGLKLQRSETLSKETATKPATLSYVSTQAADATARATAYKTEFALIFDGAEDWGGFWPRASLEAKLTSSGEGKTGDALKFRAGGYRWLSGAKLGEGTEFLGNLKYETERKTGTKKGVIELAFTPVYGGLGRYWPGPPSKGAADIAGNYARLPWLQVAPVVTFGTDLGKTMSVGSSEEKRDTVLRLWTTMRLDFELNALSYALGTRSVSAYLEGTYWHLPQEDSARNYRLGKTGVTFGLTEYLSFDLAYTVGREAPAFKFSRTGTAGFGLKF